MIVTDRDPFRSHGLSGWWARLFATALFAFYVNFIPIHLATEGHFHDVPGSATGITEHHPHGHGHSQHHPSHHSHPSEARDHHDHGEDTSHRASDHAVALTASASTKARSAFAIDPFFVPEATPFVVTRTEPCSSVLIVAPLPWRGESPPVPLLPRAPPTA